MRRSSVLVTLLLAAAVALGIAGPASAHAELAWVTPSTSTPLKSCPVDVVMRFTEAVATDGLTVTAGRSVLPVQAAVDNQTFVVTTRGHCQPQGLGLAWRTVSADDGHVASGMVSYRFGATRAVAVGAAATAPTTPLLGSSQATIALRTIGYLALAGFIGGLVFLCLAWPAGAEVRSSRVVLVVSVLAGVVSSIGDLFAAAARTTSSYDLGGALEQPYGREFAAMAMLWLLAGVVVVDLLQRGSAVLDRFAWRVSAVLVGGGLILIEGRSAHATQAVDSGWGTVSDFLHVTSMSVWVGGLLMLVGCVLPRRRLDELDEVVPRFSGLAQMAVAGIVASGLLLVCVVLAPVLMSIHLAQGLRE